MSYCRTIISCAALGLVALGLGACQSTIVPLQPVGEEPVAATQTQPATGPGGAEAVRVVDPNQTTRFIYHATYDRVWRESLALFERLGYRIDRQDYRLGVLTTLPMESPQIVEPWRRDQTDAGNALENTINDQRRTIRLTIKTVEDKPDFYEIAVQVLVERETNPLESISGPVFVEGSAFGRNAVSLRSDYAATVAQAIAWVKVGHDTALEKKILAELFKKI